MIKKLRKKVWVDGKVDFFTVALLLLVPAIPAIVLGIVLLGFNTESNFLSDVINEFFLVSWIGFIALTGTTLFTFYCLDKATDHPHKVTEE